MDHTTFIILPKHNSTEHPLHLGQVPCVKVRRILEGSCCRMSLANLLMLFEKLECFFVVVFFLTHSITPSLLSLHYSSTKNILKNTCVEIIAQCFLQPFTPFIHFIKKRVQIMSFVISFRLVLFFLAAGALHCSALSEISGNNRATRYSFITSILPREGTGRVAQFSKARPVTAVDLTSVDTSLQVKSLKGPLVLLHENHSHLLLRWERQPGPCVALLDDDNMISGARRQYLLQNWGHSVNRHQEAQVTNPCGSAGDTILWTKHIPIDDDGQAAVILACASNSTTEGRELKVFSIVCPNNSSTWLNPPSLCVAATVLSRRFRHKHISDGFTALSVENLLCGRSRSHHQCLVLFHMVPQVNNEQFHSDLWRAQRLISFRALVPFISTPFRGTYPYLNDISINVWDIKQMLCREAALAELAPNINQCELLWFHHIAKHCHNPSPSSLLEHVTCVLTMVMSLGYDGDTFFGTVITSSCSPSAFVYVSRSKEYDRIQQSSSRVRSHLIRNDNHGCPTTFGINVVVTTTTTVGNTLNDTARTEVTSHWYDVALSRSPEMILEHVSSNTLNVPLVPHHTAVTRMSLIGVAVTDGDKNAVDRYSQISVVVAIHVDDSVLFAGVRRARPLRSSALLKAKDRSHDGMSRSLFMSIFSPIVVGHEFHDELQLQTIGAALSCYELPTVSLGGDSTTQVCQHVTLEREDPGVSALLFALGLKGKSDSISSGTFFWSWRDAALVLNSEDVAAINQHESSWWTAIAESIAFSVEFERAFNCRMLEIVRSSQHATLDASALKDCTAWTLMALPLWQFLAGLLAIAIIGSC